MTVNLYTTGIAPEYCLLLAVKDREYSFSMQSTTEADDWNQEFTKAIQNELEALERSKRTKKPTERDLRRSLRSSQHAAINQPTPEHKPATDVKLATEYKPLTELELLKQQVAQLQERLEYLLSNDRLLSTLFQVKRSCRTIIYTSFKLFGLLVSYETKRRQQLEYLLGIPRDQPISASFVVDKLAQLVLQHLSMPTPQVMMMQSESSPLNSSAEYSQDLQDDFLDEY
jgi:hypothetical protein